MAHKIRKAMVLCAGLGTRLLPITERYPKPLVPVLNLPNVIHTFILLETAGIKEVVINLYHLPERLEEYLAEHYQGNLRISFSKESQLMGTGGGLKKASAFFDGEPFVLANCDFISDIDLRPHIFRHADRKALATMILYANPSKAPLYSKVGVLENYQLCSLPKLEVAKPKFQGIFTGIHILENEVLSLLEERPCGINEILYPSLMKHQPDRVFGDFMTDNYWLDTGDFPTFYSTSMECLSRLNAGAERLERVLTASGASYQEVSKGVWVDKTHCPAGIEFVPPVMIGKGCAINAKSRIGPNVIIGENSLVGEGAVLENCVVLPGSRVEIGAHLNGVIAFEGSVLPTDSQPKSAS